MVANDFMNCLLALSTTKFHGDNSMRNTVQSGDSSYLQTIDYIMMTVTGYFCYRSIPFARGRLAE